jgi:hypothetical protein
VYDAWATVFHRFGGAPRDNWSMGWHRPDGSLLRVTFPPLRFSLLRVPSLRRTLTCRETAVSARESSPLDVECEIVRFRFVPGT